MSAEPFQKKFYRHHQDSQLVNDAAPHADRDAGTLYELPQLREDGTIVLPVTHGHWSPRSHYSAFSTNSPQFIEFGMPFYIVATKEERGDYEKIYEKIRRRYAQFCTAEELHMRIQGDGQDGQDDHMEDVVLTKMDHSPVLTRQDIAP